MGGLQKCGPAVLQVKSSMMALVWRSCVEATPQSSNYERTQTAFVIWLGSQIDTAVRFVVIQGKARPFHYWEWVRTPHGSLIIAPPPPALPSSPHTKKKGKLYFYILVDIRGHFYKGTYIVIVRRPGWPGWMGWKMWPGWPTWPSRGVSKRVHFCEHQKCSWGPKMRTNP